MHFNYFLFIKLSELNFKQEYEQKIEGLYLPSIYEFLDRNGRILKIEIFLLCRKNFTSTCIFLETLFSIL